MQLNPIKSILGLFGFNFDPESTLSKVVDFGTLAMAIAVPLGLISKENGDGILSKITNFGKSIVDWLRDKFTGLTDPEQGIAEKGMLARLDQANNNFAVAERNLGIPGVGEAMSAICKEGVKKGGDPIANGRAVRAEIVTTLNNMWAEKNPTGDPATVEEKIETIATAITGITAAERQPRVITAGYVGMLMQAQKAKDADGTLAESDVAVLMATPQLKAMAQARQ